MHYENNPNTIDYGAESIVCHILISSNYDARRFDALQNNSHNLKLYNVPSNFDRYQLVNI